MIENKENMKAANFFKLSAIRMQPIAYSQQGIKNKILYDWNLEGLRGLAALSVAFSHVFGFKNYLDPGYHPSVYWAYLGVGRGAVLLFFIMSGYVIGITNKSDFSATRAFNYLGRRFIRLFPIYAIAVVLGAWINPANSFLEIIGNLLFFQNVDNYFGFSLLPIQGNPIVWTLNYEVLYYLIFLIIWCLQPKILNLFIGALILSILGWFNPQFPQFIAGYSSGWIFWLTGLFLAWRILPQNTISNQAPLLSYLLLFYATNRFDPGKVILNGFGFPNPIASYVNLSDLALLPISLLIITRITKRHFIKILWLEIISFLIPVFSIIGLLLLGRLWENEHWILATILTIASMVSYKYKTQLNILEKLSYFGNISYGVYLLHFPLILFITTYFTWQGTIVSFWVRFVVWLGITIGLASFLELVMQPNLKNWFCSRFLQKL